MSSAVRRLDIVKQVFASRENEYLRQLGEFQKELDQAAAQLLQLRDYRDRHMATMSSGLATDPGRLQNRDAFQRRLNEAISQQEQLIHRAEIEREEIRRQWLLRRAKTQSLEKLCDQRKAQELREELVREQKQQDELVRTERGQDTDFGNH